MNYRFHSVLFAALNDSPAAPPQLADAVEFARRTNASMTLFDAIPPMTRVQRTLQFGEQSADDGDLARAARTEQLWGWAEAHRTRLRMGSAVGSGRRSVAVARRVSESRHDLIIVAPNGSVEDLSIVRRLIRSAPCPLLVLKGPMLSGSVVAAVDPDDDLALNVMIAMSAQAMAVVGGHQLHVVHSYEPHGVRMLRAVDFTRLTDTSIDAFVDRAGEAHRAALDELVGRITLDDGVATHVQVGSPLDVIARNAVELEASLVVVGAGGQRGMPSMLIGHTAERIVSTIAESTLIVKAPAPAAATDENTWFSVGAFGGSGPAVA